MLYSKLFGKTQRSVAREFESKNHELLTKAGFIDQVASGIYNLLPLGKRVLSKIENIVREEMNAIGGQEVSMPLLQPRSYWDESGRWVKMDILFKTKSRYGQEYAIAPTHEEMVTPLAKKYIESYRDLPLYLYHITTKFRDEPRPKSGILRGREFGMKDLYSFHATKEDFTEYYKRVIASYLTTFNRLGLNKIKITEASGGTFTKKFSHEFNVITSAGEVTLICCNNCTFAQNEEIAQVDQDRKCPKCGNGPLIQRQAIEVGNIFDLETKFSDAFDLKYIDRDGKKKPIYMGCYGIGTTRLMGAIVEVKSDSKGIIWPDTVTPYQVYLIGLDMKDESIKRKVHKVYKVLKENNIEVLFDDRKEATAGEKFADCDLIGIPIRLVVSKRTGEKVEYKERTSDKAIIKSLEEVISLLVK